MRCETGSCFVIPRFGPEWLVISMRVTFPLVRGSVPCAWPFPLLLAYLIGQVGEVPKFVVTTGLWIVGPIVLGRHKTL